ncbi:MAG TPA: hypothetical protein PKE45_26350 [Caldilineaceae bacterium]|nr:hypothetical protein [Caldilineaceae bacterium]
MIAVRTNVIDRIRSLSWPVVCAALAYLAFVWGRFGVLQPAVQGDVTIDLVAAGYLLSGLLMLVINRRRSAE